MQAARIQVRTMIRAKRPLMGEARFVEISDAVTYIANMATVDPAREAEVVETLGKIYAALHQDIYPVNHASAAYQSSEQELESAYALLNLSVAPTAEILMSMSRGR